VQRQQTHGPGADRHHDQPAHLARRDSGAGDGLRIPTKAATYSNLIAATIPI
jgi:hypothetical protein